MADAPSELVEPGLATCRGSRRAGGKYIGGGRRRALVFPGWPARGLAAPRVAAHTYHQATPSSTRREAQSVVSRRPSLLG